MAKSNSDMALAEYEKRPWLKWYPEGVPADLEIPEKNVIEMVDEAVKKWGKTTAMIFYGNKMKHKEIHELSLRFATALHDLGVKKGDKVAILLPNCPQFPIVYYGILRLGATATTVSPLYTAREVGHQLKDSGAKIIVVLDLLYENVEKVWDEVGLKHAIVTSIAEYMPGTGRFFRRAGGKTLEAEISTRPGVIQFQDLIKKYPPNPPKVEVSPDDLAALPYTGGTTGWPKGAMISHRNIVAVQEQIWHTNPDMEEGKEVGLAILPFYHIYGQSVIMLSGAFRGGGGVVFPRPDMDEILDAVEKQGVTLFYGVPTLYKYLADHRRIKRVNFKKVKRFFCGADTLHEETRRDWERETGREIIEGYGLTETTAVTHTQPFGRNRPGTLGVPIPNTHSAIAHMEKDEFLPPKEEGEIVVSGPQVLKGYWKKPEANKNDFFEAGGRRWFRTGDVGWMDEEGYFHFVERTKDVIKYKGLQVFPHEIEDILFKHPKIKEAAVIGVPDKVVGERVKAIVVLEREYRGKMTEKEIMNYCEDKLAHYKIPKIVEFRGEIPKTDVMKVDHKKLRTELFKLEEEK
jgi:long-chain acyl-CoA synthetase